MEKRLLLLVFRGVYNGLEGTTRISGRQLLVRVSPIVEGNKNTETTCQSYNLRPIENLRKIKKKKGGENLTTQQMGV